MRAGASGRIRPALGERRLISARTRGREERKRFCLGKEEEREAAKRVPSGLASGVGVSPALTRAASAERGKNSPAAIRRRFAARISASIGDPDERLDGSLRLPFLERGPG